MTAEDDVIADVDFAIDRFTDAIGDADAERRALRNALAVIYELRAYREDSGGLRTAYHMRAKASNTGRITEGIVWVRGKMTHRLTEARSPSAQPLLPGLSTHTGEYTLPGSNIVWRPSVEVTSQMGGDRTEAERRGFYDAYVAGQPVREGLHSARKFLVNDPGPTI